MSANPSDRTVHSRLPNGSVITRDDRAGTYYQEFPDDPDRQQRRLTVGQAVKLVRDGGLNGRSFVYFCLPDGRAIDARVRRALGVQVLTRRTR